MDAISEYQKWKQQGESLRLQAKQAMETRFRDLLLEAAHIAQEYHRDFGAALKPPASITTFRYKTAAGSKAKKKTAPARQAPPTAGHAVTAPLQSRLGNNALAELQRRRVQVQKKLEAAKAAGKPTRNLEDKLYQVEDEIRLAGNAA
ncbi:MAG: hypothetical protein ABSC37_21930 [Xanthobacteraceae bacterium]|jgi:hypothetical protein